MMDSGVLAGLVGITSATALASLTFVRSIAVGSSKRFISSVRRITQESATDDQIMDALHAARQTRTLLKSIVPTTVFLISWAALFVREFLRAHSNSNGEASKYLVYCDIYIFASVAISAIIMIILFNDRNSLAEK